MQHCLSADHQSANLCNNCPRFLFPYSPYTVTSCPFLALSFKDENRRHFAIATHRHLCQALLSARERMLLFWHEIAMFLQNQFQPIAGERSFFCMLPVGLLPCVSLEVPCVFKHHLLVLKTIIIVSLGYLLKHK